METLTIQQLTQTDIRTAIRAELEDFFAKNSMGASDSDADDIGGMELALELTGLAKPTIYSLCSRREIPHSKTRKRLYFSRKELIDWISNGKRKTQAEIATEAHQFNKK